jgi:diguanylate cyclase (GGDEF)-like protein
MANVLSLDPPSLERFLERHRANPPHFPLELSLADNLVEVLRKANEFVPSEAGSILLDDPRDKHADRRRNTLTFLAAFGEKAAQLVGETIPAHQGIAGHVYLSGHAYFTSDAASDAIFDPSIDQDTEYRTRSLVAIPIRIGIEVCGVLELINRLAVPHYDARDRNLLEIFAGYIAIAIQNVLDGKLAHEYAKRDNLTGLYNDRFLHSALELAIAAAREENADLALLFLDLDYFKHVNDRHGHLAGSQVLREVGQLLKKQVEDPPAIVARYGGDEFVIAVPRCGAAEARALAERLRVAIEGSVFSDRPGEIQVAPLHLTGITCSIGIANLAAIDRDTTDVLAAKSLLLRLSDSAMYRAKEHGRNRVIQADPLLDAATAADPRALTPSKSG